MFANSAKELTCLARQLAVLRADQLWRLACWLSPFGLSEAEHLSVSKASWPKISKCKTLWNMRTVQQNQILSTDALNTTNGNKFAWNTFGLHCIYKCISSVSGAFSTKFPTEFRDILQVSILKTLVISFL